MGIPCLHECARRSLPQHEARSRRSVSALQREPDGSRTPRTALNATLGRSLHTTTREGNMPTPHRVVIVGGGFAGLTVSRSLKRASVSVTLLDRRNFHLFQPLLYQVAT